MLNEIKILVIAAPIAGSASSAFPASEHHRDHDRASNIERYSDPQLFEGRNSALWNYSG
jgi:hypothetical protein